MSQSTCQHCGEAIPTKPPGARGRQRKYCSKSCTAKASRLRDPSAHRRHQARYRASVKGKVERDLYLEDWQHSRTLRGLEPRSMHPLLTHLTSTLDAA